MKSKNNLYRVEWSSSAQTLKITSMVVAENAKSAITKVEQCHGACEIWAVQFSSKVDIE